MGLKYLITSCFLIILASGCNKSGDVITKVTLQIRHHDHPIGEADVQIYLNRTLPPKLAELDNFGASFTTDAQGRGTFDAIPLGTHYFVSIGFDDQIREQVIGHMPISFSSRQPQVDTILYVGEEEYFKLD